MDNYFVLVVDDEKEIRDVIEIYLKNEGITVIKAKDGIEAIEKLNEHVIHLIILDMMMPRLDGISTTFKIREKQNIPIIILSAKSEDMDKILGLQVGADDYVTKPFNPMELIARVKSQLRRYVTLGTYEGIKKVIDLNGLTLEQSAKEVTVHGEVVKLTPTELLKTPDLTVEDREAYIQIIDRKSKRLKVLIDDLFEASKMVSGSIELVKEKVDVVQLLQQALAEHNETISESNLQFRVTNPEKPVYAIVDGQKLWRVFDNLIGNILKYSLENTRVFISVKALHDKAIIVFKNVAKYELGEDIDDLFERFKRGDTSRNTEGSGLGLAIAKSIVDLHGGSLDIEVDGDLFKITVSLNTTLD